MSSSAFTQLQNQSTEFLWLHQHKFISMCAPQGSTEPHRVPKAAPSQRTEVTQPQSRVTQGGAAGGAPRTFPGLSAESSSHKELEKSRPHFLRWPRVAVTSSGVPAQVAQGNPARRCSPYTSGFAPAPTLPEKPFHKDRMGEQGLKLWEHLRASQGLKEL